MQVRQYVKYCISPILTIFLLRDPSRNERICSNLLVDCDFRRATTFRDPCGAIEMIEGGGDRPGLLPTDVRRHPVFSVPQRVESRRN
jgi:hypothetical protein